MPYIATKDTGICDLCITFSTGKKIPVKLKKGEVLPTDCIDKGDLNKSLRFGGLKGLLSSGWIKEVAQKDLDSEIARLNSRHLPSEIETARVTPKNTPKPYANVEIASQSEVEAKREKGMTEIIKTESSDGSSVPVEMVQFQEGVGTDNSGGLIPLAPELSSTDPRNPNGIKPEGLDSYDSKTDFGTIHTYAKFDELNHPDQLLYIKQCTNKTLLGEIVSLNSKKQIQNNSRKRLEEIQ